ncbi:protein anon-37Cs [Stomoxys calcitrans]|uniref:protein anon-37Cs n=1 Tax=Stomoxys calcitrans TaxID=35570 RepID=UPI0027E24E47|nr:protein anon-37Cs [Stomoxys calcitrans]
MQCFKNARRKIFNATILKQENPHGNVTDVTSKSINDVQTVIIGAGLAGLSAAHHLMKHGFKRTIILEASDRYGGRINSKHFGDAFCELGAKWITIDASHNSVYELLQQTSGLSKKIQTKTETVYIDTKGGEINKHIPEVVDIFFKKLCAGVELKDRYAKGNLHELNNVYTYFQAESSKIINAMFKEKDRLLVDDVFNALMKDFGGKLGCNLEYLNIEQLIKFKNQFAYPIYIPTGMNSILHDIIMSIDRENLLIGRPVGEIKWFGPNRDNKKSVNCLDGSVINADHIICTLPLGVLKTFAGHMFKPTLPVEKIKAINNLGFGSPVKIYFEYKKPLRPWFLANVRPLWSAEERLQDRHWTKQVVEISRLPSSTRVLEITIGGAYYDEIEKLPDPEVIDEITKLLRAVLKNPKIPFPSEVLRSDWSSSACYLGGRPYFSTSSSAQDIQTLSLPLGVDPSLLFAGDATTLNGFGTVDGARMSGIREAQRIIDYYKK